MTQRTVFGCILAVLLLALVASVGLNMLQFITLAGFGHAPVTEIAPKDKFGEKLIEDGEEDTEDRIVHIDVEGMIVSSGTDSVFGEGFADVHSVKRALEQALEDENVKGIVLRVNSPGGEVTASDTIYAAVKEAAEKKPVVVFMDSMATSGGYYVSCGASKVIASETTLTASIGVIMASLNYSGAFDKVGLEMSTFVSGKFKDTLSGSRPMREDEKQYIQELVGQMYERFLGVVADARKLKKDDLRDTVADGRVVTGRDALKHKLVDQIGRLEDAYAAARELAKTPGAMVVKYHREVGLFDFLGMAQSAAKPAKVEVNLADGWLPRLHPGRAYFLPGTFAQ